MRIVLTAALAVLAASPAFAQAPAAPASVFQILRATDKDMTCEGLSAEVNSLNAEVMQQQTAVAAVAEKSARGRAMLGRLGGAALSLGGQSGLMNGVLSNPLGRGALSAASQMASSTAQGGGAPVTATAAVTPQQQRLNILMVAYQSKGC